MARTLLDKVWEAHTVRTLPSGQTQLLIGLHLIHEVTTPQAFQMLKELKLKVRMPERTFGTLDHIIPTADQTRPYADPEAEEMAAHMYRNMKDFGLQLFDMSTGKQGIVHVIGPELGLTQPGMTIACGDSHTSTHGAVGAIAFGIGTTQVRDVLATQCLAMAKPKLRQVRVDGALARGVYAKDVILAIINQLGVKGGVGYAYEYAGSVIERMTMEERLTVCNMSIEGGARCGYVSPDQTTLDYVRGRPYAPEGAAFDRAVTWWKGVATEPGGIGDLHHIGSESLQRIRRAVFGLVARPAAVGEGDGAGMVEVGHRVSLSAGNKRHRVPRQVDRSSARLWIPIASFAGFSDAVGANINRFLSRKGVDVVVRTELKSGVLRVAIEPYTT